MLQHIKITFAAHGYLPILTIVFAFCFSLSTVAQIFTTLDDFTDGDYTANPIWTPKAGTWQVSAGWLQNTATTSRISTPFIIVCDAWQFDVDLEVTSGAYVRYFIIMTSDNSDPGGATTDGYYIYFDGPNGDFYFRVMTNGGFTNLITYNGTSTSALVTVKITRTGNTWELFTAGISRGTAVDGTYASSQCAYQGVWITASLSSDNHGVDNIKYQETVTDETYSGTVYTDEGITSIADGTAIRIRVNGTSYTATTTTTSGNYSFASVTTNSGNVVQVYIDGVANTFGCVTTVVDGVSNLVNLNVYQNHIIVRHDNAGATTNADLATYDGDDDADLKFTSNAGTFTVSAGQTLYTTSNFTPGGNVNADSLIVKNGIFLVNGTYSLNMTKTGISAGTGNYIIDVRSGGTLKLDNGTSVITRTDVDSDIRIQSGGELNIANGTLTGFDYHQIEGVFNISGGDLTTHNASGLGRIKFTGTSSGSQTGGVITFNTLLWALVGTTWNATAGLVQTTGNGISNEASIYINELTFYINNLTINGEFAIQNSVTAADLDIRGNLAISALCTLNSNGKPITITGNWTNNGTYTSGTNTVTFNGTSTINTGGIANHNFYNVILNGTSATLSNHINIDNDFTITNGTWNVYSGGSFYDMYVAGDWINNATFNCTGDILATFDDFSDGDYTNNPAWTVQSGGWDASLFYLKGVDGLNNERISVPSAQAYGTWEFKYSFEVATTNAFVRFFIIMTPDNADPGAAATDGYYIWVDGGGTTEDLQFRRMDNGVPVTLLTYDWIPGTAWHTVKVTRNMSNTFEVFYDGSSVGTVADATYTSSSYMGVWTTGNIDNDDHKIDDIKTVGLGGTVTFDGSATQYVQGSSITTFNNLTINNSTATVDDGIIMQQSFNVFNTLLMSNGAMDMGNYNIYLKSSGTLSGETNDTRIFTSGTGTGEISATRTLNAPVSVNVAGIGAVITDAANLGSTTIERGHKAQTAGGNSSIQRYCDITSGTPTSATFRFYFFDRELNGQTAGSNLKLWKSNDGGATWSNESGTWTNAVDDYVEKSGIAGFSRWTVSDEVAFPLPIELLYFSGKKVEEGVLLYWETVSEINNDYFTIERGIGEIRKIKWGAIGTIEGAGNSNVKNNYFFVDQLDTFPPEADPPLAENLSAFGWKPESVMYYRLKQTDSDGGYEYSDIIAVRLEDAGEQIFIFPIPVNNDISIFHNFEANSTVTVSIYNPLGATVFSMDVLVGEGHSLIHINDVVLNPGFYFLSLQNKYKIKNIKFIMK